MLEGSWVQWCIVGIVLPGSLSEYSCGSPLCRRLMSHGLVWPCLPESSISLAYSCLSCPPPIMSPTTDITPRLPCIALLSEKPRKSILYCVARQLTFPASVSLSLAGVEKCPLRGRVSEELQNFQFQVQMSFRSSLA